MLPVELQRNGQVVVLPWGRTWSFFFLLVAVLFTAGLWAAHYPSWRVAVVGLAFGVRALLNFIAGPTLVPVLRMRPQEPCSAPMKGVLRGLFALPPPLFIVALTGGLRSPFLVSAIAPLSGLLISQGWTITSKAALGFLIASAVLMAALPAAWFGPTVAEPAYVLLTALALISVASLHTGYIVSLIGALHKRKAEIDRAREQMASQALARARELEQMSAQLSHELKNPLGAIKTLVQLSRRSACDDKSRERLEVAESEVERMNCILKEYLSFSRPLEKLRRERLSLSALVDEVILLLEPQATGAGVGLRRRGDARIDADPRRLREALFNLVANALEATPRGGSVEIEIAESDGAASVRVRDSGRGMPPDVLERVGTPFFTTREQGTGLGVAMARSAFVQHGGELTYASAEGLGTTATGTLPFLPGRSDGAPAPG
jgi:signal transduction histidine kinase